MILICELCTYSIPRLKKKNVMKCFASKTIDFLHQTVHFDGNFQSFQPSLTRLFTLSELSPPILLNKKLTASCRGI